MDAYFEIIEGGKARARELFDAGIEPDPAAIEGWEFDGCNLFAAAKLFGIRKFRKGFFRHKNGNLMGYNIPIAPSPDRGEWVPKPDPAHPRHFGFYTVRPVDPQGRENNYTDALLLHYGEGNNPLFDGSWVLRDYLRQPYSDNPDILIGAAFIALGPVRIFSNFFVLRRSNEATFHGENPRLASL